MRLVIANYETLESKYGNINANVTELKRLVKDEENILVLVSSKEVDIMKNLKKKYKLPYDYLYLASDSTVYDRNTEFLSYAYSPVDMKNVLIDRHNLTDSDVKYVKSEKKKRYTKTDSLYRNINE